jgi:preprotein translocase SecF subunit
MHTEFNNKDIADLIQQKTTDTVDATVQTGDNNQIAVIKTPPIDESVKNEIFEALKTEYNLADEDLLSVSSASASFGNEVQRKALTYTLIAIICMLIYIIIRFEWRSAVMAVIALAINIVVMGAVYTITNIPLNTTFIAAMLTVVGYSINNTIVIFDRIRENLKLRKKNETITEITDRSVMETLGRTINSTVTTLITIVLIYILGVSTIREFALPLIVGILAGAYTSIFIASGFLGAWKESEVKARAAAAQERRANKKK